MKEEILKLNNLRKKASLGGGKEKVQAQHNKGKLTAIERINLLLDPDSFIEIDKFTMDKDVNIHGDSVIVGTGKINNKNV